MAGRKSLAPLQGTRRRHDFSTDLRYLVTIVRTFRWTIVVMIVAIVVGAILIHTTPESSLGGRNPSWMLSIYGAWMALFAQPVFDLPDTWYLALLQELYPLLGVLFIGEGLVRFALLMVSRRRGEKEWMLVMASTYRDHVVLCGLGHLGYRVLLQLVGQGRQVVAIEKDGNGRFIEEAKESGAVIIIRDMKDDESLIQAGVPYAQALIAATDDDMANLEVALDAKRMNPKIRTAVRLFDQATASKLRDAFGFDFAFSPSALAAPTVAAMALGVHVISAFAVAGEPHVIAEVDVRPGSRFSGVGDGEIERETHLRVLRRTEAGAVIVGSIDDVSRAVPSFTGSASARS